MVEVYSYSFSIPLTLLGLLAVWLVGRAMHLPPIPIFKERSQSMEAVVPVVMLICVTGIYWLMGLTSWNPFVKFPYSYEALLISLITLVIPTLAFLYATGSSFRLTRLTFKGFGCSALLGSVAALILLLPTIIFSGVFLLALEKASPLYLFAWCSQSVCEEVFFRGFLQTRLEGRFGSPVGLLLTAVLFNLSHGPTDVFTYGLGLGGFVASVALTLPAAITLGYLALRSESLVGSSIFHIAYNLPLILRP